MESLPNFVGLLAKVDEKGTKASARSALAQVAKTSASARFFLFFVFGVFQVFSRARQATGTLHTLGHSLGHSLKNVQTEKWPIFARVEPFCPWSPKFRDFSRNVKNGEMAKKCEKPDRASGRNTLFYWKKQLCPKIHNVSYCKVFFLQD